MDTTSLQTAVVDEQLPQHYVLRTLTFVLPLSHDGCAWRYLIHILREHS